MRAQTKKLLLITCLSVMGFCCATLRAINVFPESKDLELGLQIDQEIRKDTQQYPIFLDRPQVKSYVEQVGSKILASPEIRYKGSFAYKFEVIFDKILGSKSQRGGLFERLLSTHPLPQDRVESVKKMLAQIGDPKPTEAQLFSQRYQIMKKSLP